MRLYVILGILQMVLGLGVVFQRSAIAVPADRSTSSPASDVEVDPDAAPRACSGTRPCCEFADDHRTCDVFAVCFAGRWACP